MESKKILDIRSSKSHVKQNSQETRDDALFDG